VIAIALEVAEGEVWYFTGPNGEQFALVRSDAAAEGQP
jgi:hypothetical protein